MINDAPFTQARSGHLSEHADLLSAAGTEKGAFALPFRPHAGGVLFLGPSESPAEIADEFDTLDEHWKIYRKRRDVRLPTDLRLPMFSLGPQQRFHSVAPAAGGSVLPDVRLMRTYDAILEGIMPPSVLINERREILHTFCGAGKWLVTPDGRPSADILDRVDRELKPALAGAIQRVTKEMKSVVYSGVPIGNDSGPRQAKLTVRPIFGSDSETFCMLISLESMDARRR